MSIQTELVTKPVMEVKPEHLAAVDAQQQRPL